MHSSNSTSTSLHSIPPTPMTRSDDDISYIPCLLSCTSYGYIRFFPGIQTKMAPADKTRPATSPSGVIPSAIAALDDPLPLPLPLPLEPDDVGSGDELAPVAVVKLLSLLASAAKPIAVGLYRKTLETKKVSDSFAFCRQRRGTHE